MYLKQKYKIKSLSSSIIYGPNASGKTNIIGAMDVLRSIVLRGNIKNSEEKSSVNIASSSLEFIPNSNFTHVQPVNFFISFIEKETKYDYYLSLDLGVFMDSHYNRKILKETLTINNKLVFDREDDVTFSKSFKNTNQLDNLYVEIMQRSLNPQELFLTNGFKIIISSEIVNNIVEWFTNKFMIIYRADSLTLIHRFSNPNKKAVYVEKTTDEAVKLFGVNNNGLGYIMNEDENQAKLYSLFNDAHGNSIAVSADLYESYGTIRFVNMFPLVIKAILTGGTLVVDEFDASIHPMALMSIINIFHNDDINIHHAQLIFNTHNPIFLNSNLLRRDEIKFIEREMQGSILYTLADFKTSGPNGVRKNEDYMKNYFVNQYGAIRDIDFTPIFEEIISQLREK